MHFLYQINCYCYEDNGHVEYLYLFRPSMNPHASMLHLNLSIGYRVNFMLTQRNIFGNWISWQEKSGNLY